MFVERTTSTFLTRLVSNLACVICTNGRCAWHIFWDRHFFLAELSALEKYCIFNIVHACLWSELLLHFLPDWFLIWNMSFSGRVDVRDIFFPYELSALGISLIVHISHACWWRQLLLHFLPDWFEFSMHYPRVCVCNIFFTIMFCWVMCLCYMLNNPLLPPIVKAALRGYSSPSVLVLVILFAFLR